MAILAVGPAGILPANENFPINREAVRRSAMNLEQKTTKTAKIIFAAH